jgi:hypothetical protein
MSIIWVESQSLTSVAGIANNRVGTQKAYFHVQKSISTLE